MRDNLTFFRDKEEGLHFLLVEFGSIGEDTITFFELEIVVPKVWAILTKVATEGTVRLFSILEIMLFDKPHLSATSCNVLFWLILKIRIRSPSSKEPVTLVFKISGSFSKSVFH
jgi:hypothetical protein